MLNRILYLLVSFTLVLNAAGLIRPLQTTIALVEGNNAVIYGASSIPLGSTGIVIHKFDAIHEAIMAKATLIKKEGDKGVIHLSKFDRLKQDALPTYRMKVKRGDTVIMNYLYNRAMAITPNGDIYRIITKSYPNIQWLHPDIFAASLASSYDPSPNREAFQNECKEDEIGLLLFAIDGKGYFVDCDSFKVLDTIPLPKASSYQTPFYNRLGAIKGRIFGIFGSGKVKDYSDYYKQLLGITK